VQVRQIDGTFPLPTEASLTHASAVFASIPDNSTVIVDGLAFGAMADIATREASRLRIAALLHLPLAADPSLDPVVATRLEAGERRALAAAALVVVTGAAALPILARCGVPRDRVVVVEPGTDAAPLARGSNEHPLQLLCVATLNPGKGHELLLQALSRVPHRDWRLACAGSLTRHPPTVARVRDALQSLGLSERVALVGELDETALSEHYDRADVFVLATIQETYGMAVAEALARGLPIVSTATGAIPTLVGEDAGIVVPAGDVEALGDALTRVIGDTTLRDRLRDSARRARTRLRTWEDAVGEMSSALEALAGPLRGTRPTYRRS
jgi:glycosyltransferase involved in cell wall biosynthesis